MQMPIGRVHLCDDAELRMSDDASRIILFVRSLVAGI